MAADVCLLLMQSLNGDCQIDIPTTMSDPVASLEGQKVEADRETVPAPAAIAPMAAAIEPQFASTKLCEGEDTRDLMVCTAPSQDKETVTITRPMENARAPGTVPQPAALTEPVALNIPLQQRPVPIPVIPEPQFSRPTAPVPLAPAASPSVSPASGAQLFRQRQLALQAGQLYTRLSGSQFANQWRQAAGQPSHEDWVQLLAQEARAVAGGQGQNRLEVVVGDSFGLWLPTESLPRDRLWLNQSISGDTTGGILQRLSAFASTRPTTIHILAGANDLKNDVPEAQIAHNLHLMVQNLQQQHPQAQIVVYSVLPTRRADIDSDRVRSLNTRIAAVTQHNGVEYRDVHAFFEDETGNLRTDLTTDGLHLNEQGYALWQQAILASAL